MNYDISQYNITENGTLLIADGKCSTFGVNDPEDNGIGAWGYHTNDNPLAPFCSLPIPIVGYYGLQPGQEVTVEYQGRQVECFLADKGPSTWTGRLIDLCPSVTKRLRCETDNVVRVYIPRGRIVVKEKWC